MFSSLFSESVSGDRLLWLFLDASVKASVILALAAVVCWSLRRQSAALRHRIWTMAIVGSLVVPVLTVIMPRWTLAVLPAAHPAAQDEGDVVREGVDEQLASAANAEPAAHDMTVDPNFIKPLIFAADTTTDQTHADEAAAIRRSHSPAQYAGTVVLAAWLAGVLALVVAFVRVIVAQILRHRQLFRIEDGGWNDCVSELSASLGLRRRVVSYESSARTVPLTCGILRPILIVPDNWHDWDNGQRRSVLLHELAHVKRFDVFVQLMGRLGAITHWFNPLVWYAVRQLRIERELACDDCVLLAGQRPSDYAEGLLRTLRSCRPRPLAMGVAMAHSARIDQRVAAILDPRRPRLPVSTTVTAVTLLTSCVLLTGIGGATLAARPSDAADDQSTARGEESDGGGKPQVATDGKAESEAKQVFKFSGKVLHGDDPVAGATVTLWWRCGHFGFYGWWHPREEFDYKPRFAAISNEDGDFEFTFSPSELSESPYNLFPNAWRNTQVVVSKDGMGVGSCELASLQARKKIWIRNTTPVRGRVIDLEGQRVPGASIRFYRMIDDPVRLWQTAWKSLSKNVKTDNDGNFSMHGLPTNRNGIQLYVSGPTIATKIFSVRTGEKEGEPVEVIVEPTKPIVGTVRAMDTGKPLAGVIVYGNRRATHGLVRAITDEQGRYRLTGLPKANGYHLRTFAPVSSRYLLNYADIGDTPGLEPLKHDLTLRRGVPVRLTIVDKRTGERIPHPDVHYTPTGDNPLRDDISDGPATPNSEYQRFHTADGNGVVHFLAYPGPGVVGVGLRDGKYLPAVLAGEAKKKAPLDIHFQFAEFGSQAVAVIDPKEDDTVVELELEADPGEVVGGRLIDERGKPIPDAIAIGLNYNARMANGIPRPSWRFQLDAAEFKTTLMRAAESRMLMFVHDKRKLIATATATAGKPLGDVQLRPWGAVTGIVTDADGKPVAGVEVFVDYPEKPRDVTGPTKAGMQAGFGAGVNSGKPDGYWPEPAFATTDKEGRFVVERLIPGQKHTMSVKIRDKLRVVSDAVVPASGETREVGVIRSLIAD
jgi:beta-lactamase regulating signal transducer with metallopeptidase domain